MTQINLSDLIFHSSFSGLGNNESVILSLDIPSTSIEPLSAPVQYSGSVAMSNANSISQIEAQLTDLDSNWYIFKGYLENLYTSSNELTYNILDAQYYIDLWSSYTSNTLVLTVILYSSNFSEEITIPAFTVNLNASLYTSPFLA